MNIVCLDLEGVLIPEIWIAFAEETGIGELRLTTRDISDYDVLMKKRLDILKTHGLTLSDIQKVISKIDPMDGAFEFLNDLRSKAQVIILSDTFEEFAKPLMKKLGWPTLFCNSLVVGSDGIIQDYTLRQKDGKFKAVNALRSIGANIIAAGDSYNDLSMIKNADHGFFFCPPQSIVDENPEIPAAQNYTELGEFIQKALCSFAAKEFQR